MFALFEKFKYKQSITYLMLRLTSQEKKLLHGLVAHPELSLKELAELLDINYWSAYKMKDKFRKRDIIKEVLIPNYKALGFELFVAGYGSITQDKVKEINKVESMIRKRSGIRKSGIFLTYAESYRGFTLGVVRNYTQLVKNILYADRIAGIREIMLRERPKVVLMPFEITRMPIFFEYAPLLAHEFSILAKQEISKKREPEREITAEELKVLAEMVKAPASSVKDIAQRVKMNRLKVAKIRERLFQEGWCTRKIIPNMKLFGYEVLVFAHWESNPEKLEKIERENKVRELNVNLSNVVFLAYNPLEGIVIALFKSLRESREIVSLFSTFAEREQVLVREPEILFLSMEEGVELRSHDHYAALSSIL